MLSYFLAVVAILLEYVLCNNVPTGVRRATSGAAISSLIKLKKLLLTIMLIINNKKKSYAATFSCKLKFATYTRALCMCSTLTPLFLASYNFQISISLTLHNLLVISYWKLFMIKRENEEEHSFFHFESITGNSYLCTMGLTSRAKLYVHRQKANRLLLNVN